MKTTIAKLLTGATLTFGAVFAEAGVTISPMVGQMLFDNDMDLDNEVFASFALGYQFDGPLGIEISYLLSTPDVAYADTDMDFEQARLDALYHFNTEESVMPYLLIGGGNQWYKFETTEYESSIFNVGGGIKAMIAGGLSLRSEVRLISDLDMEWTSYAVGLGLNYEFGRKGMVSAPVAAAPADTDGDGVADSNDTCPGTPAGVAVDINGCEMDSDGDGVADTADNCPDTSAGAVVDANGCYIVITETKEVNLKVNFANNSNDVPVDAYGEIEQVADFMKQYPLTKVEIAGHTDDRGSAAYNQKLSQQRAEAVAKVLTEGFDIDSSRVTAVGYGEAEPLVSNDTAENRAMNRRVTASVSANVETIQQ